MTLRPRRPAGTGATPSTWACHGGRGVRVAWPTSATGPACRCRGPRRSRTCCRHSAGTVPRQSPLTDRETDPNVLQPGVLANGTIERLADPRGPTMHADRGSRVQARVAGRPGRHAVPALPEPLADRGGTRTPGRNCWARLRDRGWSHSRRAVRPVLRKPCRVYVVQPPARRRPTAIDAGARNSRAGRGDPPTRASATGLARTGGRRRLGAVQHTGIRLDAVIAACEF